MPSGPPPAGSSGSSRPSGQIRPDDVFLPCMREDIDQQMGTFIQGMSAEDISSFKAALGQCKGNKMQDDNVDFPDEWHMLPYAQDILQHFQDSPAETRVKRQEPQITVSLSFRTFCIF